MAVIKNSLSCHLSRGARHPVLPKGLEETVSHGNEGIRHVNMACPKNSSPPYK